MKTDPFPYERLGIGAVVGKPITNSLHRLFGG